MKKLFFACLTITLFASCAKETSIDQQAAMEKLKSLEGIWQMQPDIPNYDSWSLNEIGLAGSSYSVNNTDTTRSQLNTIELVNDTVTYSVTLMLGEFGKTINFKLVEHQGDKFVFEAKDHDFPRRLTYMLRENVINEFREGVIAGAEQQMELKYKRVQE